MFLFQGPKDKAGLSAVMTMSILPLDSSKQPPLAESVVESMVGPYRKCVDYRDQAQSVKINGIVYQGKQFWCSRDGRTHSQGRVLVTIRKGCVFVFLVEATEPSFPAANKYLTNALANCELR